MNALEGPLVFVDVETNGLSHIRGNVIEVAAIRVEAGKVVGSMNQLLDPGAPLPAFITTLTGITDYELRSAPSFHQIADELHQLLEGALFVAHNVRFDYAFLKQEFKRLGREFRPRQLCTMRLSRALYPNERSHKLESLINRHGFATERRHRAYDDAQVLWKFLQHVREHFAVDVLQEALGKQLRQPSLPKAVSHEVIAELPDTPGVYIFEDEKGYPLYVGKSIHIRQRVLSHFARDHEHSGEFKIAQQIHNIRVHKTAGELSALLLESRLVKELQPLYNRQLRKINKLALVRRQENDQGYVELVVEEANEIDSQHSASILGVFQTRSKAKQSIDKLVKDFSLCPKLCGLEKSKSTCFPYQLRKCNGACVGKESHEVYNQRVLEAFGRIRIQEWPYSAPILVSEGQPDGVRSGIIVDQWCVVGRLTQEPDSNVVAAMQQPFFDLDTYKILRTYLTTKNHFQVTLLSSVQLSQLQS